MLKHPRLMPYHRLIVAVVLINLGLLGYHLDRGDWPIDDGSALSALAALTLVNFAAAVLIRQQNVLNVLFGLAGRGSRSWPLWLRWSVSKVHHVGGIHAGAALAGTAWLGAFTAVAPLPARASRERVDHDAGARLLPRRAGAARRRLRGPPVRSRAHNVFELSHRLRRLDGDRALLGADASARRRAPSWQRLGAGGPDGERRLAVAAAAARRR